MFARASAAVARRVARGVAPPRVATATARVGILAEEATMMSARRALSAATSTPWALERGDPVDRGAFRAFARSPHAWHPRAFSASAASAKAAGVPEEAPFASLIDDGDETRAEGEPIGDPTPPPSTSAASGAVAAVSGAASAESTSTREFMVPVRAYYVGNFIDFHALAKRLPGYEKEFFNEHVVVTMSPSGPRARGERRAAARDDTGDSIGGASPDDLSTARRLGVPAAAVHESMEVPRHFVVYKYGSVVFFNMGRREREECLKLARHFTRTPLGVPCTDDYRVMVRPGLDKWSHFETDRVVLKRLDLNNISVIGTVMAQTVALEHHELKVDNMIEIFSGLNKTTEETGEMDISKARLFKLVAENNNTLTELVTRMRLLGRSDTAWQYAQYDSVWNGLRKDFELEDRFSHLDYKLDLIQTQVKFYLEILQNRKSDTLEWIIIVLISMEICVSLYDMSTKLG
jgi:uncharacterized Rmd1/YagE family protein